MNLVTFNERSYRRLIQNGYTHLWFKNHFPSYNAMEEIGEIQILKAVKTCDNLPDFDICVDIYSAKVHQLLKDDVYSFVIFSEELEHSV